VAAAVAAPAIDRLVLTQDETATLSAVSRPLPDIVLLCTHVDAVVGFYYVLMRGWVTLAGTSPVALRLPSVLLVAAAAGFVTLITQRMLGTAPALVAGLVVAVCPAVTQFGREARPYALTLALASVATGLLLRALVRPDWRRWWAWGAAVLVLGLSQLTAVLLLGGHAVNVLAGRRELRLRRPLVVAFLALLPLVPLAYAGHRQRGAVAWIPDTTWRSVWGLPAELFGARPFAAVVIALGAIGVLLARRTDPAALIGFAVAVVPAALLVAVSFWIPLLRPRYLLFTLVGWALFAAAALAGRRVVLVGIAAVAIVASAVPAQVQLWNPVFEGQADTRALAKDLYAGVRPGDAVLVPTDSGRRVRVALRAYRPDGATVPDDVLVRRDAVTAQSLDARECRPATCVGTPPRVWAACVGPCLTPLSALRRETGQTLAAEGYRQCRRFRYPNASLTLYASPSGDC
jgi:mannosyltransferase